MKSLTLTASTWHELETIGKFDKNAKLSFISDDMLILGCDVGSETHYLRAIDTKGRELSKSAYSFRNNCEGFQSAKEWAVELAAKNGISVVQVNPYCKLRSNGMPVPLLRNCYSIFNGTKYL